MTLNYYSPLRLIRGLAPGMLERGDGHIINVATWGVLSESSPLFAVYNASKAALSAVSRVIETEWAQRRRAFDDAVLPAGEDADDRADEGLRRAARADARARPPTGWSTAARTRPVRIAPRMAVTAQALDSVAPGWLNAIMKRQTRCSPASACTGQTRDRHARMEILASRMLFRPADYQRSLRVLPRRASGWRSPATTARARCSTPGQSLIELAGHGATRCARRVPGAVAAGPRRLRHPGGARRPRRRRSRGGPARNRGACTKCT